LKIFNDRYIISKTLFREANTSEYIVKDTFEDNCTKRLKIFDAEMSNYDFIHRLQSNFVSIASIIHPNILRSFEFQTIQKINENHVTRKQYFYTFEHYEENERISFMDLSKTEVNAVIKQLCKALIYLHYRGFVYKYLNFDSLIIVRNETSVHLYLNEMAYYYIDDHFYKMDHERFNHFIAPEVLWGEEVTPTADIYSLGVILYYLYYQIDYKTKGISVLNNLNQLTDIQKFILKATDHINEERHQSVYEFSKELSSLLWIDIEKDDFDYYNCIQEKIILVGRESVIKEINQIVDDKFKKVNLINGIFIQGEKGSGKTRLLNELNFFSNFQMTRTINIDANDASKHSYPTLHKILISVAEYDDVSPMLIQKYGHEILTIAPELSHKFSFKDYKELLNETDNMRILNRAYNFFLEYTATHFMILLIDNEESIQPKERYFYELLMQQKNHKNYIIIYTGSEFNHNYENVNNFVKTIKLSSLTLEETGLVVQHTLGMNKIPYRFTHRIIIESQGKPSITKNIIKKLWLDKVIYFDSTSYNWNLEAIDDNYKFDYVLDDTDNALEFLSELNSFDYDILCKLAYVKTSFNINFILEYTKISEEEAYLFVYKMEEERILTKKISDVEYVFGFNSNTLKQYLIKQLSDGMILQLAGRAADVLEKMYHKTGKLEDYLIDYLIESNQLEKAAEYSILFSKTHSNSYNSLDLLEQGFTIYEKLGNKSKMVETSKTLINDLIKNGKLERAIDMIDKVSALLEADYFEDEIDLELFRAKIYYYKNDVPYAIEISNKNYNKSLEVNYITGEFDSIRMKCKCLRNSGETNEHEILAKAYLKKSYHLNLEHYQAVFENEMGISHLYNNEFKESIASFQRSLNLYLALGDEENIISGYNNLGVIYEDGFGDFYTAREYFKKAQNRASVKNYLVSIPTYLNNIGETYHIEGRYGTAIRHFEESYFMADSVGDKNIIVLALLNLSLSNLLAEDYERTHTLLTRLDHEINNIKRRDFDKFDYYLLHFEYYLKMNDLVKLLSLKKELEDEKIPDDYRRYRLNIINVKNQYKRSHILLNNREISIVDINQLKSITKSPSEAKLLRVFINEILIDLINSSDYFMVNQLVAIDDELKNIYDTNHIRIRRDIIDACLSEDSITRLTHLLKDFQDESKEMLWRIHKLIGDQYYQENDLYFSLQHYLMAMEIIAELTKTVAPEYKEHYVLNDEMKLNTRSQTNKISMQIFNASPIEQQVTSEDLIFIDSIDHFFDLNTLQALYKTEKFEAILRNSHPKYKLSVLQTSTDLISSLGTDERVNIKTILLFFEKITLSEKAMLLLIDGDENISEVITPSEEEQSVNIAKLISNLGNDFDGTFINILDQRTNTRLLDTNKKGIIIFPIFQTEKHVEDYTNRKEDLLSLRNKIYGYIYIETDNIINRINEKTFNQCKSYMNLLYLMVNNYYLKTISTIDKLTGVFLRKHIEQIFSEELVKARNNSRSLSVIMLDIDKFKSVNDNYGHRKGDVILSSIGTIIKEATRKGDFVGRYGGEEFIIVLPETNHVEGYKTAEKIRIEIENCQLLGEEVPLTVSLGIATFPDDGSNEDELIERSDQALYYSKNNGRNRSTSWDESITEKGHRYDKLTGIISGNMSSDTRNVQALIDILNELDNDADINKKYLNTFITLIDITEADEINFIKFSDEYEVNTAFSKQKGHDYMKNTHSLNAEFLNQFKNQRISQYFIDWDDVAYYDAENKIPNWKSYIVLSFNDDHAKGILAISVNIKDKEFDFSNFNFVDALKPVLKHILFY